MALRIGDFRIYDLAGLEYLPGETEGLTLVATGGVGATFIKLDWNLVSADTYHVYKVDNVTGTWVHLTTTTSNTLNDYAVALDTFYFYYVASSTFADVEISNSNVASAKIQRAGIFSMATSRATSYQGIRIGFESTPGTIVATTKILTNMELMQVPQIPVKSVDYAGTKGITGTQKGQRHTEARFNGILDYNLLTYLTSLQFGVPTPVADANTVKMYTWSWTPSATDPLLTSSATVEQGSSKGAEKFGYGTLGDQAWKWSKEDASIEGTIFGTAQVRNATMTPTIRMVTGVGTLSGTTLAVTTPGTTTGTIANGTYVTNLGKVFVVTGGGTITAGAATLTVTALAAAITAGEIAYTLPEVPSVPVDPSSIAVYISTDGVTYTQLLDTMEGQITLNGLWKPSFHVNDATSSFDRIVELNPNFGMTITTEEGTEADNFMSFLDAGQRVYVGFKATGPTINVSPLTKHLIRLNIPMIVTQPDPGDKSDVYGNTFTLQHAHDLAFGLFQLTIQNKLATL